MALASSPNLNFSCFITANLLFNQLTAGNFLFSKEFILVSHKYLEEGT